MKSLHAQERSAWNDDGEIGRNRRGVDLASEPTATIARKDSDYSGTIIGGGEKKNSSNEGRARETWPRPDSIAA